MQTHERTGQEVDASVGLRLDICPQLEGGNPREEMDNLSTLVVAGRHRHGLGDQDGLRKAVDLLDGAFSESFLNEKNLGHVPTVQMLLEKSDRAIVLPLYLYEHGGRTIRTTPFSCPWDSGQVGFVFVSKADAKREYGWTRLSASRVQRVISVIEGEVSTYDQYLRNDVWGYTAYRGDELVDACAGFYGRKPAENGMLDALPEEFHPLVHRGEFTYLLA